MCGQEEKPSLEVVPANATGPRCLNEDAAIRSKATTATSAAQRSSAKSAPQRTTSKRHQRGSWNFGPGKIAHGSKEYDSVMQDIFGEGGFPLEKEYSIQSASLGVSLFAEKEETDISEMKSNVLKRASAVLIMRPRSALLNQQAHYSSSRQRAALASGRNRKLVKGRVQKKLTGAQTDLKAVTAGVKSDPALKLDLLSSSGAGKKNSLPGYVKARKEHAEPGKHSSSSLPEKPTESDVSTKKDAFVEENASDVRDSDDDMSDIPTTQWSQGGDTESKSHPDMRGMESCYNRVWDKSAVPKPWDKWASLDKADANLGENVNSSKPLSVDSKMTHISQKTLLKPTTRPSTGRSWNHSSQRASTSGDKRPQTSASQPAARHSWTGEYYSEAEKCDKSDLERPHSQTWADNLPLSKRLAVVDWLDKHVNSCGGDECQTSPSSSLNSTVETEASSLADMTAQAAGVEAYESRARVAVWLASVGLKRVERYAEALARHQVQLVDLPSLTVPVLQHMGITQLGPIMKIMRGVDKLKVELSRISRKMRGLEDFDHVGRFQRLAGAAENQNLGSSEAARGAFNSTPPAADRPGEGKEPVNCNSKGDDEKEDEKYSPAERAETLRSSLHHLYRQLSREQGGLRSSVDAVMDDVSQETCPFDCTNYSETSANLFQINCESDAAAKLEASQEGRGGWNAAFLSAEEVKEQGGAGSRATADRVQAQERSLEGEYRKCAASEAEMRYVPRSSGSKPHLDFLQEPDTCEERRVLHRTPLPHTDKIPPKAAAGQSRKSANATQSRSNGSVTKATGKTKERPSSSRAKGQADPSQLRPASGKIDTGWCTSISCIPVLSI